MGERDILTHCFHDMECGILDENDRIRDSVHAAMERGVIFDVGHGAGSFSWDIVQKAMAQGVEPTTISSDLHIYMSTVRLRSRQCRQQIPISWYVA